MKYTSIFHNETGENTWLVYDELTRNGVIIDPGCKIDDIMDMINENDVKVRYILLTHCHYDHIMSLIPLKNKTNAEIVTGARGSINLGDPNVNITLHGLGYEISGIHADKILKDNEILSLDGLNFKCIYTPGHTSCGVCYLIENDLFCGDTLFLRSCGRWDLPTGDMDILFDSIRNRLYTLPDNTIVHSGHGSDTSIGYEKKFNFCVRP
ncbi:MAG: MBL fold metallo-hydrolase [Clostridia bacterium]|nr:MBL fold metallo-hydrolase [Clostridia bacterium]